MKNNRTSVSRSISLATVVTIGALALFSARGQESPQPQPAKEDQAATERKIQEQRAEEQPPEARRLKQERQRLREAPEPRAAERDPAGMAMRDQRRQELKRRYGELQGELQELRRAGKGPEAAEVEKRVKTLEQQLARMEANRQPMGEFAGPIPRREGGGLPPMGIEERQRRLQHLQAAIDNLHAAGMHEPAERLAQQKERMLDMPGPAMIPPREGLPGPPMDRLQGELRELRKAVEDLRNRVEELSRARR